MLSRHRHTQSIDVSSFRSMVVVMLAMHGFASNTCCRKISVFFKNSMSANNHLVPMPLVQGECFHSVWSLLCSGHKSLNFWATVLLILPATDTLLPIASTTSDTL